MKVEERFEGKEWSEILGGDKVGPERSGSAKSGKSARKSAKVGFG